MMPLLRFLTILSLVTWLAACSGGGGGSDSSNSPQGSGAPSSPAPGPGDPDPNPDPPALKSVTLSWNTPSSRADGNPLSLTEIGGYEVYYFMEGSSQGEGETLLIADPNVNQVTTPRLIAGTYHFAIASYDSNGTYSELSDYITARLQ